MQTKRKAELELKYCDANLPHEIDIEAAQADVNEILDALPASPRNNAMRSKYANKATGLMMFWLVAQDVDTLLMDVIPIDPPVETPVTIPPAEEKV